LSTELYIQGYSAAGEDGLETPEVLTIFRIEARPDRLKFVPLAYDTENSCELSVHEADGKATALTVFRPCVHERFWADVFGLLSRGPYLAFMPGSPILLVNAEVGDHLPEGMAEALGTPRQVSTVGDLVAQIMNG
jgi:hypothetical protein